VYDVHKNVPVQVPKSYGKSIKPADLPDGIARFFPTPSNSSEPRLDSQSATEKEAVGTGLPAEILLPILRCIREDVAEINSTLEQIPLNMVASSLLIIYEADWDRAREGLKYWIEEQGAEDEEDDGEDSDEGDNKPGLPYVVKLIDFAHTHLVPEKDSNTGVILGVETTLRLLDGRIEQVTAMSSGGA
jgi:inositol-polyphosphate multikinase